MVAGSSAQLCSYDFVKRKIDPDGSDDTTDWKVHLQASLIAGACSVAAFCPFDLISSRLYMQRAGKSEYSGFFDCLKKTVRSEGIAGLYQGAWRVS